MSRSSAGVHGNGWSLRPIVSADGNLIAFESGATNLTIENTYGVFVHDRRTGQTRLASVSSSGTPGNNLNRQGNISADGTRVGFTSTATNFFPGDPPQQRIFLHDLVTGMTHKVSLSSTGADANNVSSNPVLSFDGRYIAFESEASNLVPGDTNDTQDVFVRDFATSQTWRVSISSLGVQANGFSGAQFVPMGLGISWDGRFVSFQSLATNLVPGDTNGLYDIFVHDRSTGTTTCASVSEAGAPSNGASYFPSISADGRFVAFESIATNLWPYAGIPHGNVIIKDLVTGRIEPASGGISGTQAPGGAFHASISADGRRVAYCSNWPYLVPGDLNGRDDIFVYDRLTRQTTLMSLSTTGAQTNNSSYNLGFRPHLSEHGTVVVFNSWATNLVPGDLNAEADVFARECAALPASYCTAKPNSLGCLPAIGSSGLPSATAGIGFTINALNVRNRKAGLLLYSLAGPSAQPFQGGTLCIAAPVHRTPTVASGGSVSGNDCTGVFSIDFNAYAAGSLGGNPRPALQIPGTSVDAQWHGRDPGFAPPNHTTLSDALDFVVGP